LYVPKKSKFSILPENCAAALKAIKDLPENHYSWVDSNFRVNNDLPSMLEAWGWEAKLDPDGKIIGINFYNEKMGDDAILLRTIAPFVVDGSYIEMHGEDGACWRWVFVDEMLKEIEPKIDWGI
jgi:hypothetical protein